MLAAFRSPLVDTEAKVKPVARQPCRKFGNASHPRACRFVVERRAYSPVNPSAARHTARIHPKSRATLIMFFENLRRPKSQCWHESNLNDAIRVLQSKLKLPATG